ncbi:DUF2188 domain-containing protein [Microbacterium yannicii]|uniref:DUF2188 domain-containing protein n=1 Tax=Microbacterium yannicii TaxID=671622 RepID=UPI0002D60794|nr:DUF2188 domain-containing protein [Microbacterium yannicii]
MDDTTRTVVTRSNRGQWEVSVEGRPDLSRSYASREEAVDGGRTVADELGVEHVVEEAEPTGAITDEQDR